MKRDKTVMSKKITVSKKDKMVTAKQYSPPVLVMTSVIYKIAKNANFVVKVLDVGFRHNWT